VFLITASDYISALPIKSSLIHELFFILFLQELLLRKLFLLFCPPKMIFHILFVSTLKWWLQMVQRQWQLYVEVHFFKAQ